ncbi:von Willebrand factor type A (vWA) domain-containing protein [Vibrio sinaloensis DSM 21326]|uniref:von Willebrand factor type A (VWA) domain-containing protein n=1 Tax=Vibrio sinaloensis DSM 21326 TaxID=945550 RepID=E8M951_PHOS4|nr:VIT and VWA domain-containing protein [Vibrio sinaloensis]EGA69407.1 von Willebrand factor type A (vWA) domain-containing protein [Vibrio sinaloensis DSM 21326]
MLNRLKMISQTAIWGVLLIAVSIATFSPKVLAAGLLKPVNSQYKDLQIESHHVDVAIQDGYATTSIEQTFYNPNDTELEALYSFPVPQKAVVGEFIYWINGSPVIAEAVSKEKARKIYDDQKAQGNATALTEKDAYKTFDIRVYPVQPQQSVKVRLVYMQDALLDHGIGRYVYPLEEGGVDEAKNSFWTRNDKVEQDFSFNVTLRSAYSVDGVRLPAHPAAMISQQADGEHTTWKATISNHMADPIQEGESVQTAQASMRLDQDVVFYWRLQEGLPGRVDMVAYRDPASSKRGTVKLTFTPGDDLTRVTQGRDWVFVLDKSGSMSGKYSTLVEGVRQGLGKLPSEDRFRVVMFDSNTYDLTGGFVAVNAANVTKALQSVEQVEPSNGTNLYEGMAAATRKLDDDRPTGIVLVTDGVANVGVTEKRRFFDLMEKHDVRLFTFIMGNSANTPLLVPMTKLSNGIATSVSNADDIIGHLMSITSKLTYQAYRNIQLDIDGVKIKDLTPQQISSLYRGEQLTVFGHYFKGGEADIKLTMGIGGQSREYRTKVTLPDTATEHPELERMWAFSAIRDLQAQMDYLEQKDHDKEQAIEDIALEYGLLTDYTSLLVVEEEVFQQLGIERKNQTRVLKEQSAREIKQNQPVKPTRVDKNQPTFSQPTPSYSGGGSGGGGGSMNILVLLSMILLVVGRGAMAKKMRN